MDISSQEIEAIVKQVLAGMGGAQTSAAPAAYTAAPGGAAGDRGVFENVDDAVEAAWKAQRDWAANYKIEDRQRIIEAIRRKPVKPEHEGMVHLVGMALLMLLMLAVTYNDIAKLI